MKKVYDFNRAVEQKKVVQDNNEILENAMEALDLAISSKEQRYKFIVHDSKGEHIEYRTREQYLEFYIEHAMNILGEHSYFYEKEGIDKYEGECK